MLTSHAANATQITGSIKRCGSRVEDLKLAFMSRQAGSWDIFGVAGIIWVELREQEVPNEAS
jgi:hypothetical protein